MSVTGQNGVQQSTFSTEQLEKDRPGTKPIIMAVDDYEPFLTMVQSTLEMEGYTVWTAQNGQQALDLLLTQFRNQDRVPDLILADIMMPVMDGYAFYEHVRGNPYLNHVPFIFLTAKIDDGDVRRGKEMGVDDYLLKPCEADDLLASVRGKLRRIKQRAELQTQYTGQPTKRAEGSTVVFLVIGLVLIVVACVIGSLIANGLFV